MKDLSGLAKNSMWPTSQAGGNMIASSEEAMTAPGSPPVDNLVKRMSATEEVPTVADSNVNEIAPATSGKPQASGDVQKQGLRPGSPAWGATTVPDVVRDDSGAAPAETAQTTDSRAAERESRRIMSQAWKNAGSG